MYNAFNAFKFSIDLSIIEEQTNKVFEDVNFVRIFTIIMSKT